MNSVNLGIVLRWTDPNNWYKVCIDGQHLAILRDVGGQTFTIKQTNAPTGPGILQRLRFRATGSTLLVKVWSGTTEPDWQIVVDDHTFTTGRFGIRVIEQPATVITIASFSVVMASVANDA